VGRLGWRIGLRESHDASGNVHSERGDARGTRPIVQKTIDALLHEAFLPAPDAGLGLAGSSPDLVGAASVRGQQHDPGPPDLLVWRIAVPHERLQTKAAE
jgi:hypothetical protein